MFHVRYVLLSPHNTNEESRRLLNLAYHSWKKTFNQVLGSMGCALELDDFFRYDMIGVLLQGDSIIGSHCYSLFDLELECCQEHHYMSDVTPETRAKLIAEGRSLIYSLEYTNITPEWRKSATNIRWVDVLMGCALKYLDESAASGIIGTPRVDIKMDTTCIRMGGYNIQEPVKKMNYECTVVFLPKLTTRTFYSLGIQQWVDSLWQSHESFVAPIENNNFTKKTA